MERGNRSGVGLAAFTGGGFLVDGGRDETGAPPPIVARLDYPEAWRVVLLLDPARTGVHGAEERRAFGALPRFPAEGAAGICRLVLMQVLPALATADPDRFGHGIGEIQRRIGDYFAPFQGGRYASAAVAAALAEIEALGIPGHGQSSWGPTGFALVGSQAEAEALVARLRPRHPDLDLVIRPWPQPGRERPRGAAPRTRVQHRRGSRRSIDGAAPAGPGRRRRPERWPARSCTCSPRSST